MPGLDPDKLRRLLVPKSGAMFDGSALDKTTEALAIEMAKLGYPFAHATPRTTRDAIEQRIDVAFVIDEGQRTYVEHIEIHGNTRTRDYVIRREFDIGEGDAYNKTLIDRAEKRLKDLNYFKSVKITTKPGSAPDRVVLDVETVDQATGDFNVAGGYSTTDGWMGEVKVGDRNFLGTRRQRSGRRELRPIRAGRESVDHRSLFARQPRLGRGRGLRPANLTSPYQSYGSNTYGANFIVGTPVTETTLVQWRYSLYDQNITIDPAALAAIPSLPVRQAAAAGRQLVSAAGETVTYNTLDNNKLPSNGVISQLRQDLAGLGGDVKFLRTSEDVRYYHSLGSDLTGMVRAQGGYITGWGGQQVPMIEQFLRRPEHGARLCAERLWPARSHARLDHGQCRR